MRLLGQPDENDSEAYANDAADDDDLDAYARRERGRTHVVFNLRATTYSDDFIFEEYDEDDEEVDNTTFNVYVIFYIFCRPATMGVRGANALPGSNLAPPEVFWIVIL